MITTSDTVAIVDGTMIRYAAPDIRVRPLNVSDIEKVSCLLEVLDGENVVADARVEFTEAEIDGTSTVATSNAGAFQEAAEKVVKGYLEGLAANSGATFAIV